MEPQRFTRRTLWSMELLKEKGDSDGKIVAEKLDTTLALIEPLLFDSFGADGLSVFFQKTNGKIKLTRSGLEILDNLFTNCSHPIETLLLRYCRNLNANVGDGIKRFLFYSSALLKLIRSDRCLLLNQLKQLKILGYVLKSSECLFCSDFTIEPKLSLRKFKCIVNGYFLTRFTRPVGHIFSELVVSFITSFLTDEFIDISTIRNILINLDVLCIKHNSPAPLLQSKIHSGFLLKGKINNNTLKCKSESQCILKLFQYSEENVNKEILEKCESDIIRLIAETRVGDTGDLIKVLFITNITLSDSLLFYLRIRNVISVEGVLLDDIIYINDIVLKRNTEPFEVNFQYFNDHIILSLPQVSQLIVCSPTDDLRLQLKDSLKNVLNLISYSLTNSNTICDIDNKFELMLLNNILLKSKSINFDKPSILVNKRSELLQWHQYSVSIKDPSFENNLVTDLNLCYKEILNMEEFDNYINFISCLANCLVSEVELKNCSLSLFCDFLYHIVRLDKPKLPNNGLMYCEFVTAKLAILNCAIDFVIDIFNVDSLVHTVRNI